MNIFRLLGDFAHILAIVILLLKIWKSRSCSGLSGKSQLAFAIVFTTRYLDLFTTFVSLYNTLAKLFLLVGSYATCYMIFKKFRPSYDSIHDSFRIEAIVLPCAILSIIITHSYAPFEILWTFSIYLEAVAILPQLFLISKTGEAEIITSHYLFALGSYRAFYILNWIYRYYAEDFFDLIAIISGIVQTILYLDFFYLYVTRVLKGRAFSLPA